MSDDRRDGVPADEAEVEATDDRLAGEPAPRRVVPTNAETAVGALSQPPEDLPD